MAANPVVVFGAGSIGRGLLGQLLSENGMPMLFVEPVEALRCALAESKGYTVRLAGRQAEDFVISGYEVAAPEERDRITAALASCPFAATAVGGVHLPDVANLVTETIGGARRAPLPMLLCENWPNAAEEMAHCLNTKALARGKVVCVPSSVERMVRPAEGLGLVGESCESLFIDGTTWPGPRPALKGFAFVEALEAYYKRKLFTNNAGHALLAYEGALRGCDTLCAALEHSDIAAHLKALLLVAAEALHREYGLGREALDRHVRDLLIYRYPNEALGDTVARVGRQPLRKLGREERLTGLLRLLAKHGLDATPVHRAMAAALCYFDPDDEECIRMREMIRRDGPAVVLESACGLSPGQPAFEAVLAYYGKMER